MFSEVTGPASLKKHNTKMQHTLTAQKTADITCLMGAAPVLLFWRSSQMAVAAAAVELWLNLRLILEDFPESKCVCFSFQDEVRGRARGH